MTLEEAVAEFESGYSVIDGLPSSVSQTGEGYTEICSGSSKGEGEMLPVLCSTPHQAAKLWLSAARDYAKGKCGFLYWRVRPEMGEKDFKEDFGGGGHVYTARYYVVYSRFLISDKPQVLAA